MAKIFIDYSTYIEAENEAKSSDPKVILPFYVAKGGEIIEMEDKKADSVMKVAIIFDNEEINQEKELIKEKKTKKVAYKMAKERKVKGKK